MDEEAFVRFSMSPKDLTVNSTVILVLDTRIHRESRRCLDPRVRPEGDMMGSL